MFTISTILPGFLFLGPELTEEPHVEQLRALGVKRILNLAMECDADDHGLQLAERFEKYSKIPTRDTVEEENIVRGVREACDILGTFPPPRSSPPAPADWPVQMMQACTPRRSTCTARRASLAPSRR